MSFKRTDRAIRRGTEYLRGKSKLRLQEKLTGRIGRVGSGEFGTGVEPYGPLQKTPSSDHPYYKAKGWTNRAYGATYNITQKGEDYYNGAFQSYPQDNQHSIWIEELLGNAPQTRGAFVDATNMLFNRGVTLQDHHTAELLAAEFYDRGYITYDEE